uniref:ketopantoate reductase family protein n=1 Tax=Thaumasiovibrio occultus TaxID=1891184 RepID=UPI00131D917B|nr:2-dehydropantoate 2-reductase [Thaumasiovibrio occultus]
MKFTIVGAGAIGSLFACILQSQHHQVHCWTRSRRAQIQREFHDRHGQLQTFTFTNRKTELIAQSDAVIVCVKAFQTAAAVADIAPYLDAQTPLILCHNGIGTHSAVMQQRPEQPLLFASTSQAALKQGETLYHTGVGPTFIGWLSHASHSSASHNHAPNNLASPNHASHTDATDEPSVISTLRDALNDAHFEPDILPKLWEKLAINCAINPLTALHNISNGQLAAPLYQETLKALCDEVSLVATAEGYPMAAEALLTRVKAVIQATAANHSSMHQDIHHQRRTEIDYISGYLVQRAYIHHIEVPANHTLWQAITQREQSYV